MRPSGSASELEKRRRHAVRLYKEDLSLREIARRLEASPCSVHHWVHTWKKHGDLGLAAKKPPGRPTRFGIKQKQRLTTILSQGAVANGFPNEFWTLKRIGKVIKQEFDFSYHLSHIHRILKSLGWSCQVPDQKAWQRDEEAILHWMRYKWPALKKSP